MTDLPNFVNVTLEEAVAEADSLLTAHASEGPLLSDWVAETNAVRAAAKVAYEAETVELLGVTLVPGETLVTLTINERYGSGPRRHINCVFVKQAVASYSGYSGTRNQRERRFYFLKYGGSEGSARQLSYGEDSLVKIEPVSKTPEWIAGREARRKQQEAARAEAARA